MVKYIIMFGYKFSRYFFKSPDNALMPVLSDVNRISPTTATFAISNPDINVLFEIAYYINTRNSFNEVTLSCPFHSKMLKFCVLQSASPIRTFRTNQSSITINNLGSCMSYWVVVTAINCTGQMRASPVLINTYMSSSQGMQSRTLS